MIHPIKPVRSISKYLAVSIASYLAVTVSVFADATWVGDTSNLWNDATNWTSDPTNPTGNFFINTATGNLPVLNAGSSFTPVDVIIGDANSTGRFDQRAGSLSLNDISANGNWFFVGRSGGTGFYNLVDTSVITPGSTSGFGQGSGSLTIGKLWVGGACFFDNGTGVVNVNTTGTITANSTQDFYGITAAPVILGFAFNGTASGTINLENGTIQANGEMWVGRNATGIINQSGGTVNTSSWLAIGRDGGSDGRYNLSGGTVNAATAGGFAVLGSFGGSQGELNVSGGTFNVANNAQLIVGEGGTGTVTVTNAGLINVNHPTEGLRLAANGGSVGTVNLDGGTIQTTLVTKGAGTGNFNFNGGTLKAAGSSATFMQGLTNAFVKSGGATIDSNGFDVTVAQALIADPVSTGGGLNKVGTGTLTLAGVNSYAGDTNINAGKLTIDGAIAGLTRVNSGGTLAGTGAIGWTVLNSGGAISPGDNGIGTLTVAGGSRFLDWFGSGDGAFGQMKFELSMFDNTSDKIVGLQYFTKASPTGSFTFDFQGTGALITPGGATYTLIEFENLGAINGASAFTAADFNYKNLGDGLTGTFVVTANSLQLQVVPEPASAAMLMGGVGMLVMGRRKRGSRIA